MRRGTTPTITIELGDVDMELVKACYITLKQSYITLTKEATVEGNKVSISLTQEETLKFYEGPCKVQIKTLFVDGSVAATPVVIHAFDEILDEVIL